MPWHIDDGIYFFLQESSVERDDIADPFSEVFLLYFSVSMLLSWLCVVYLVLFNMCSTNLLVSLINFRVEVELIIQSMTEIILREISHILMK